MVKPLVIRDNSAWEKSEYKAEYYRNALHNTDYVLCTISAAEYLGLFSGFFNDKIRVFTKQDCLENGIVFDNIRGTLCTTVNQTINDLLADETMDEQVIMESLAECYYKDNYASLDIRPENKKAFDYFRPMAEEYYSSY